MKIHKHWTVTTIAVAVLAAFALAAPPSALAVEPDVGLAAISEVQVAALAHPDILAQEALVNSIAGLALAQQHEIAMISSIGQITAKDHCVVTTHAFPAAAPLYAIPVAAAHAVKLAEQARVGDVPGDVEMNC